jgi:hypothetical protein
LISFTGCAHHALRHLPEHVLVEEYVSALPVGATIHLCLERLPCQTNVVRAAGRSHPPQIVTLA